MVGVGSRLVWLETTARSSGTRIMILNIVGLIPVAWYPRSQSANSYSSHHRCMMSNSSISGSIIANNNASKCSGGRAGERE